LVEVNPKYTAFDFLPTRRALLLFGEDGLAHLYRPETAAAAHWQTELAEPDNFPDARLGYTDSHYYVGVQCMEPLTPPPPMTRAFHAEPTPDSTEEQIEYDTAKAIRADHYGEMFYFGLYKPTSYEAVRRVEVNCFDFEAIPRVNFPLGESSSDLPGILANEEPLKFSRWTEIRRSERLLGRWAAGARNPEELEPFFAEPYGEQLFRLGIATDPFAAEIEALAKREKLTPNQQLLVALRRSPLEVLRVIHDFNLTRFRDAHLGYLPQNVIADILAETV
jgi:hypothetical protein